MREGAAVAEALCIAASAGGGSEGEGDGVGAAAGDTMANAGMVGKKGACQVGTSACACDATCAPSEAPTSSKRSARSRHAHFTAGALSSACAVSAKEILPLSLEAREAGTARGRGLG